MKEFTEDEIGLLFTFAIHQRGEVFDYIRKGVPQTQIVIEIVQTEVFCGTTYEYTTVPEDLVGFWMQTCSMDNEQYPLHESIRRSGWSRCKEVEVTTTTWEIDYENRN